MHTLHAGFPTLSENTQVIENLNCFTGIIGTFPARERMLDVGGKANKHFDHEKNVNYDFNSRIRD